MQETIILGGGCFWCIEATMQMLKGVTEVTSGYAGGEKANPTYEAVCSGTTGHAEVVRVTFDPQVLSLHDLLWVFFTLHNPTTKDRQGNDVGTQYRSVIFLTQPEQRQVVEGVIAELEEKDAWGAPVVTQVEEAPPFYRAEAYHQRYFEQHPEQGYCSFVIAPKVGKLRQQFMHLLR